MMPDGSVRIFSRNLEDNTPKYPDVARAMPSCAAKGLETCVLDAEVVAYDRDTKRLLPFQVLSTRSRKDVDADSVKVQVIIMAFDIIYHNGESLLRRPLAERRQLLHDSLTPAEGILQFAVHREVRCGTLARLRQVMGRREPGPAPHGRVPPIPIARARTPRKLPHSWTRA